MLHKIDEKDRGRLTFALQALLDRHESYMAESEAERRRMAADIFKHEQNNRGLERQNAKIVAENRILQGQLEGLNSTVEDSDAHIRALTSTLGSAQFEVQRLTALAQKAAELETQLAALELGQMRLERALEDSEKNEKLAISRWKNSEARLRDLNQLVEKIEKEAETERERHLELISRMERKRTVQEEQEDAAGRLKGAASASSLNGNDRGTGVVSHFMRDLLQDNANLQAGVVELRELLQTSNDEVQKLKDQLLLHPGMLPIDSQLEHQKLLEQELDQTVVPQPFSQQVHVFHHYHAKLSNRKGRVPFPPRNGRKRTLVGLHLATPVLSMPQTTPSWKSQRKPSSESYASLKPRAEPVLERWTAQSIAAGGTGLSSIPSSSYSRRSSSSIFDRVDSVPDLSKPTSPKSVDCPSPNRAHREDPFTLPVQAFREDSDGEELSGCNIPEEILREMDCKASLVLPRKTRITDQRADKQEAKIPEGEPLLPSDTVRDAVNGIISETTSMAKETPCLDLGTHSSTPSGAIDDSSLSKLVLRRASSHGSLVSISGMDIHLTERNHIRALERCISSQPPAMKSTTAASSVSQPFASVIEINASSSRHLSSQDDVSSIALLSGLAATKFLGSTSPAVAKPYLSRLFSGWVRGGWADRPVAPSSELDVKSNMSASVGRTAGINQRGTIVGLKPPVRTPSEVRVKVLDQALLQETLAE